MTRAAGQPVDYPTCGDWDCEDETDWQTTHPGDEEYAGAKRENRIARYHEPREEWRLRLQQERFERNGGAPLWVASSS